MLIKLVINPKVLVDFLQPLFLLNTVLFLFSFALPFVSVTLILYHWAYLVIPVLSTLVGFLQTLSNLLWTHLLHNDNQKKYWVSMKEPQFESYCYSFLYPQKSLSYLYISGSSSWPSFGQHVKYILKGERVHW